MGKKLAFLVTFTVVLTGMLGMAVKVQSVKANGTVIAVINPETGDSDFTFSSETPINSTFIANITVVDVEFLAAWQVNITWDPTLLRINSTDDATIPADNVFGEYAGPVPPEPMITHNSMFWIVGIELDAPTDYVNVTYGTLCQAQFTIIKNDTGGPLSCDIHFVLEGEHVYHTRLFDLELDPIPYTQQDGTYIIPEFRISILLVLFMIMTFFAFIFSRGTRFNRQLLHTRMKQGNKVCSQIQEKCRNYSDFKKTWVSTSTLLEHREKSSKLKTWIYILCKIRKSSM